MRLLILLAIAASICVAPVATADPLPVETTSDGPICYEINPSRIPPVEVYECPDPEPKP